MPRRPTPTIPLDPHLVWEVSPILYSFNGVVRKDRPDFLIRLAKGRMLVLEVKGRDSEQDRAKREFRDEWVRAVNAHGGFGRWTWAVSRDPKDLPGMLAEYDAG